MGFAAILDEVRSFGGMVAKLKLHCHPALASIKASSRWQDVRKLAKVIYRYDDHSLYAMPDIHLVKRSALELQDADQSQVPFVHHAALEFLGEVVSQQDLVYCSPVVTGALEALQTFLSAQDHRLALADRSWEAKYIPPDEVLIGHDGREASLQNSAFWRVLIRRPAKAKRVKVSRARGIAASQLAVSLCHAAWADGQSVYVSPPKSINAEVQFFSPLAFAEDALAEISVYDIDHKGDVFVFTGDISRPIDRGDDATSLLTLMMQLGAFEGESDAFELAGGSPDFYTHSVTLLSWQERWLAISEPGPHGSDLTMWRLTRLGQRCARRLQKLTNPRKMFKVRDVPYSQMTIFELIKSLDDAGWSRRA